MSLERKDNSELINEKDIDIAISFLDLNVGSETSSSESEAESSSGVGSNSGEDHYKDALVSGATKIRERGGSCEESDKSSGIAYSKRMMSTANGGDLSLDGASAKMPGTSRYLATAASSNSLKSQGLNVSFKKKRRKDEATLRHSISSDDDAPEDSKTSDFVQGVNQLDFERASQFDGPDIESTWIYVKQRITVLSHLIQLKL
ncbi:hypothetical protein V3C99_013767 [Haemonchus contortus]